jgi:radical SAM protein with 4Fe4S-binding SPASM domain
MDPKRKFFLFKQSKHFCSVPWNHFKVDTNGDILTCVHGSEVLGNVHHHTIEEILSTSKLSNIRNNLKQDLSSANCTRCQRLENTDNASYKFLRDLYNPMFVKSLADYDSNEDFVLNGVDLHWGSTCNLKCITCWGKQSSSIAQELGEPIRGVTAFAADNIINYIVKNQYSLKEIYMSGGEPTLIKHNLNLLTQLRKDLDFVIRVNTNMSFNDVNPLIEELKKFPKVLLTISADALTDRFNYIRRGADWNIFIKNLEKLRTTHFTWRVNSVFFVGTAFTLPETQEFFMNNFGIDDFTINQAVMGHTDIRCRNLLDNTKTLVLDKLTAHQDKYKHNKNLYGQLTNCINEVSFPATESYVKFFTDIDQKANTNWREIFTEL